MTSTTSDRVATVTPQGETTTVIERTFAAPLALVWETMTRPEHVRQWYGCGNGTVTTCDIDLRVGGRWHYVITRTDGSGEDSFSGEYLELDPPHLVVSTEGYDNMPGAVYTVRLTLEERDGKTYLRNELSYAAREVRDGHLAAGMEIGLNASYDALERIANGLAG